ncbi:hypothetical protein [Chryseobacterium sp.]|uniref:hypothetical protein n=1 Tax=Chryseobacterium sp. TaxID=1871047 RepID=UPI00289F2B13|nr:hypothetical protein [Chryseobacterium sp.]
MDKKTSKRSKSRGLDNLQSAGSDLQETNKKMQGKEKEFSTENNVIFSFRVNQGLIHYIKKIRLFKIEEKTSNHLYSESDVVREGIELLRKTFPDVPQRPDDVEIPTRRGRGLNRDPNTIMSNTSFTLSDHDINWIYNFIYDKQKGGGRYTKEEFLSLLIKHMEMKFMINKKSSKN